MWHASGVPPRPRAQRLRLPCAPSPRPAQVLRGNGDDAAAYWARGTAYDRLGYTAEAVADYSAVLLLDPDHFNAAYARAGACRRRAGFAASRERRGFAAPPRVMRGKSVAIRGMASGRPRV